MRPMATALILEELADRLDTVEAAGGVIFSIEAFKTEHPEAWRAVLQALGVTDERLFHYIKDGAKGSAYKFGNKEVVKFTTDPTETEVMALLIGKDSEYIVHVTDVFWIPRGAGLIGCIRQEFLQPGAPDWKNFGEVATFYFSQILNHPFDPVAVDQFKDWAVRRFSQHAQGEVTADEKTKVGPLSKRKAEKPKDNLFFRENQPDRPFGQWVSKTAKMPTEEMFEWFRGLCKELSEFGISFYDLNAGNMMKRGGVHVVIDLGFSTAKNTPQVRTLNVAAMFERLIRILSVKNPPCNKCGRTDYDDIRAGLCDACAFPEKVKAAQPAALGPSELTGLPNIWIALAKTLQLDSTVPLRKIGEGSNGTAYLTSANNVLKMTRDRTEALAMTKLIGKTSHYIVDVFRALNIGNKLYAISMEKLMPPDPDWKKFFAATEKYFSMEEPVSDETVAAFAAQWQKEAPAAAMVRADEMDDWGDINPGDDVQLDNLNTKTGVPWPGPYDDKKIHWLQGLAHELIGLDIKFGDMNQGNIMKRGGDHVVIDLGMSRTNSAPQLEMLE